MFGYVIANVDRLREADRQRYRSVYCGLCRALGRGHGLLCRMTLSYDMAFLILLHSALDRTELAEEERFRCPLHPAGRRTAFSNRHTRYAADMNLLLAYHQRLDDWADERKLTSLAQSRAIRRSAQEVALRYPRQATASEGPRGAG